MKEYTLVNSNTCTLVNKIGEAVKYDSQLNGCVKSDPISDSCLTLGLNYEACLAVISYGCSWDSIHSICTNYIMSNFTISDCSQIQVNVSAYVCS